METLTVHLTKKHIKDGRCSSPWACPMALAIDEALSKTPYEYQEVEVYAGYTLIEFKNNNIKRINHSQEIKEFVMQFDNKLEVQPFSFELNLS